MVRSGPRRKKRENIGALMVHILKGSDHGLISELNFKATQI